jgi:hypothetical protein
LTKSRIHTAIDDTSRPTTHRAAPPAERLVPSLVFALLRELFATLTPPVLESTFRTM